MCVFTYDLHIKGNCDACSAYGRRVSASDVVGPIPHFCTTLCVRLRMKKWPLDLLVGATEEHGNAAAGLYNEKSGAAGLLHYRDVGNLA